MASLPGEEAGHENAVDDLPVAGVYVVDDGTAHHDVVEAAVAEAAF